ncbi:ATP-binding protein [Radiobacillus sp. PE A8.2]|uniref:ATP-binding protein n=1 Tax=Radiobacillus sp. PE A8.2 TaxID=3380349 RepID=UPI00388E9F06
MSKQTINNLLQDEEVKGLKLFLTIFYLFLIGFDLMYNYAAPLAYNVPKEITTGGFGIWFYIIFIPLLIPTFYLIKTEKVYAVKYVYLFSFIVIDIINNFLIYYGTTNIFATGSAVELVFIFFSSLFINKRYFYYTLVGIIGKYIIIGLLFQYLEVLLPIVLYSFLAILSYIYLTRFYSNLEARLKIKEELQQSEQLAIVGQLATSITHEVRNPLTSLKGLTQLQKEKYPEDQYFQIMTDEIERISSILDDLLVIGRPKDTVFVKNDIHEMINYVVEILNHNGTQDTITINNEIDKDIPEVECNSQQIKQVLINIIKNGMEAMPDGGKITIKVESLQSDKIKITITDEGYGIPEAHLELLGNPFHTTKSGGTGLGLMVSFKIIKEHNGEIQFQSEEGKGTTVSLTMPVYQRINDKK